MLRLLGGEPEPNVLVVLSTASVPAESTTSTARGSLRLPSGSAQKIPQPAERLSDAQVGTVKPDGETGEPFE